MDVDAAAIWYLGWVMYVARIRALRSLTGSGWESRVSVASVLVAVAKVPTGPSLLESWPAAGATSIMRSAAWEIIAESLLVGSILARFVEDELALIS
jgi:hypothetical protein